MSTLQRLKAWLADDANFRTRHLYDSYASRSLPVPFNRHMGVRRRFVTRNGIHISIQQSATHHCNTENEVEMWHCPPSPLLAAYGDGPGPYAYVPLEVVAGYIDSLESLGDNHEYECHEGP